MLKKYFDNGVLTEKADNVTPGFIQALSFGLIRYMGNSRDSSSGAERPLSILISYDGEKTKEIFNYFADALETIGIEVGDAGVLEKKGLEIAFFDLNFDSGIFIGKEKDEIKIEIFERGDDIGGLEASLPGGVNFKGKVKSVPYALPIPQIAVNHIEHALNTETGFTVMKAELIRDMRKEALNCYENHLNKVK